MLRQHPTHSILKQTDWHSILLLVHNIDEYIFIFRNNIRTADTFSVLAPVCSGCHKKHRPLKGRVKYFPVTLS